MIATKRAKRWLFVAITLLIMCDTIRHMFEEVRPFDWLMLAIEALVLFLILYEVIADSRRRRADRRRNVFINEKVSALSIFMDKGLRIKETVPDPQVLSDTSSIKQWRTDVRVWTEESNAFLATLSPQASAAFMLITDTQKMSTYVTSSGRSFYLTGDVRECYQKMAVQLDNLRRIIERPEAYF